MCILNLKTYISDYLIKKPLLAYPICILILLIIVTSGCVIPNTTNQNESIALNIALNDPTIKGDIATSSGSYSSKIWQADLNSTGYKNYNGDLYWVTINTASRGQGGPYLEQFDVLVDTIGKREMQVNRRFDVSTYPESILIPGNASWYQRFTSQSKASSELSWVYIEINLSLLNASIHPIFMDQYNFNQYQKELPYYAWNFNNLGENATTMDANNQIATGIDDITAIPGRIAVVSPDFIGHGVKLILKKPNKSYYLVLINDGNEDITVELKTTNKNIT